MKVLQIIAKPFVSLWHWIKETAWVQPLLIVGVIFAVIFSIPSITSAVQNAISASNSDIVWYENKQLSLDGTAQESDGSGKDSQANVFFEDVVAANTAWASAAATSDATQKATYTKEAQDLMNKYSSDTGKFFLFFVQDGCSACSDVKNASEYLIDNWSTLVDSKYTTFQYRSIICDQEIDEDIYDDVKPFEYLFGDANFLRFAEIANEAGISTNYYINSDSSTQSTIRTNLEALVQGDPSSSNLSSNFQTPLVILIDTTSENTSSSIITSLFYSAEGSDKMARAEFLANCWQSKDIFSADYKKKN